MVRCKDVLYVCTVTCRVPVVDITYTTYVHTYTYVTQITFSRKRVYFHYKSTIKIALCILSAAGFIKGCFRGHFGWFYVRVLHVPTSTHVRAYMCVCVCARTVAYVIDKTVAHTDGGGGGLSLL